MRAIAAPLLLIAAGLPACVAGFASPTRNDERISDRSEDRAAIHALLVAYGETLDARDFDGFAALFARDGRYGGGAGGEGLGASQAAEAMRRVFADNPSGAAEPNFHVFFDEVVRFTGPDTATATSKSFWVVPGENGRPRPELMAAYDDQLVREDGTWKFARRQVESLLPAPANDGTKTND